MSTTNGESIKNILQRNLISIHGKGGVGKTTLSQAIAQALSDNNKTTLWVGIEDPLKEAGKKTQINENLWHLNCEAKTAFEEYARLLIGIGNLSNIFIKNKMISYLVKAAPGIHELVLLGKIWHERDNYDHVVIDMPSTGYSLAMFQSTLNFSQLFSGGPMHRDAIQMIDTFGDPRRSGHIIIALPEEMPLCESLELNKHLLKFFPKNPCGFIVNKKFPTMDANVDHPDSWKSPLPENATDYANKRCTLEKHNLSLWDNCSIDYEKIDFFPPNLLNNHSYMVDKLTKQLQQRALL